MVLSNERHREVAFGAGLLVVVLCLAGIGEGLLQIKTNLSPQGFRWGDMLEAVAFDPDEQPFPTFRPGSRYLDISINKLGFRGPEIEAVNPSRTLRIMFMGNSVFFGPRVRERETIPAAVATNMALALRACKVDYINVSGPRFTLRYLTSLMNDRLSSSGASAFVVMGPTAREILQIYDGMNSYHTPIYKERGWLAQHSKLWARLSQYYFAESRRTEEPSSARRLAPDLVRWSISQLMSGLRAATKSQDVVIVRANSNIRKGMTPAQLSASLLADLQGVNSDELFGLLDTIDAQTKSFAFEAGWRYIDPLGKLPPGQDNFSDATHPTAKGNIFVANSIADVIMQNLVSVNKACP